MRENEKERESTYLSEGKIYVPSIPPVAAPAVAHFVVTNVMVCVVRDTDDLHAVVDVGGGDVAAVEHGSGHIRRPHGGVQTHGQSAAVEEIGEHVDLDLRVRIVANQISVVAFPSLKSDVVE